MRRSLLLVLLLVTAACGRDAADVRFAEGPGGGEPAHGPVASAEPSPSATSPAEPAPARPETAPSVPPAAAEPATPGPSTPEPVPTASPDGPREIGQDEDARVGHPYRFNLYTHCGIETTWFDGRWWNAEPPQSDGNGNPPPGWGNPHQPGVVVLVTEDTLRFTGDEGQRADFVPRPQDQGSPPPCM
jgi:hypothetical protein